MPDTITRARKHRRNRKVNPVANAPQPTTPILITGTILAGSVLTINFDQPVTLNGVPGYRVNGNTVLSAVQTAPNVVALTFFGSVVGATSIDLGFRDPAIRNASGGYVTSTALAL